MAKFEVKWNKDSKPVSSFFVEASNEAEAEELAKKQCLERGGDFRSLVEIKPR